MKVDDIEIGVRAPDENHNHWGIIIRLFGKDRENCKGFVPNLAIVAMKEWGPFHQGGHHNFNETCSGRHFIELWKLSGDEEHRQFVEHLIYNFRRELRTIE